MTSATLLANAPNTEDACERVKDLHLCSFGVHLNVTEYSPLSGPAKLEPLIDQRGAFVWENIRRVPIDSDLADGIFEEFCAQIEKLKCCGIAVSHIDSHDHIHTIPRIFPLLKKLQKKFQIRRVRLSRNVYALNERVATSLRIKKAVYNFALRNYYPTVTTQGFSDFNTFYTRGTARNMKHRSFEVMVHPGNRHYGEDEIGLLHSPWREALRFPVRLISYNELN